jgi:hypothetical protein
MRLTCEYQLEALDAVERGLQLSTAPYIKAFYFIFDILIMLNDIGDTCASKR